MVIYLNFVQSVFLGVQILTVSLHPADLLPCPVHPGAQEACLLLVPPPGLQALLQVGAGVQGQDLQGLQLMAQGLDLPGDPLLTWSSSSLRQDIVWMGCDLVQVGLTLRQQGKYGLENFQGIKLSFQAYMYFYFYTCISIFIQVFLLSKGMWHYFSPIKIYSCILSPMNHIVDSCNNKSLR